jgi:hypothetical protein
MKTSIPCYRPRPIGSVEALGRALRTSPDVLRALAARSDSLYRVAKRILKPDGSERITYEALGPLKLVHKRILDILRRVDFPSYLMGGISNQGCIRGYIENANRHAGSAILIREDITNFFPSISMDQVRRAFLHVCKFAPVVSQLLADLCTRAGVMPQGAAPSTYLANLVLYDGEPHVAAELSFLKLTYSRFVDDITVSSGIVLPKAIVELAVGRIRALVEREGFKVNRGKQSISGRGTHHTVHRLNVSGPCATLPLQERKNIRASVKQLEIRAAAGRDMEAFYPDWQRAMGRVGRFQTLHPAAGHKLKIRLRLIRAGLVLQESASLPR